MNIGLHLKWLGLLAGLKQIWLPSSGFKLADLPVFECYMQENRQEIWIAIEEA
ncbi:MULTISPECIES: hypothetical protein [Clostridium]|uniref:hypothetical protein n=1 Tax=Clostridium TaxID=1485 RepID=UPI00325B7014